MGNFLTRYQAGECERVWAELLAVGAQVRQDQLLYEAMAVGRETMLRSHTKVQMLFNRLFENDYKFYEFDDLCVPITPPAPDILDQTAELERLVGPLPLSLRVWYEVVGSVSLQGRHPQLIPPGPEEYNYTPVIYSDPLVVEPIQYAFEVYNNWQALQDMAV